MPRYIDADELRQDWLENGENEHVYDTNAFLESIDNSPTANVAPVVHGYWIYGCTNGVGTEYCYCSECNEDTLKDNLGLTEFSVYCPHCGAKMNLEDEES